MLMLRLQAFSGVLWYLTLVVSFQMFDLTHSKKALTENLQLLTGLSS